MQVIFRIRLLIRSETNMLPKESAVASEGVLKRAELPTLSKNPEKLPASEDTFPK